MVQPQPGASEKHVECASHTRAKGWGGEALPAGSHPPWSSMATEGLTPSLGLWVSQMAEQRGQHGRGAQSRKDQPEGSRGEVLSGPPAHSWLSQQGPLYKRWNSGKQDMRGPVCAPVHSISIYTTRFGEHRDGCSPHLFLHLP